tara:strand:- start:776 stop:1066 length:291 start_codon:yes stop_codon:yes gene_type:complete
MITIDDLKFTRQAHGGIGCKLNTRSKITISIQAGEFVYSSPRENLDDADKYTLFEVAMFNAKGNYVTRQFINCGDDEVAGWVTRGVINNLLYQLER